MFRYLCLSPGVADIKIFKGIYSMDDCFKVQEGADKGREWAKDLLLKFHPDKCASMRIGSRKKPSCHKQQTDT